ncbi:hypothetical protein E6O75_ATG06379 [Venturia nashicola]|uniref:Uncharacterized protein n=1 Tax=Venturia nashicola TaxID=86259 RepID=A0A4Z1NXL8_9PEZI|nr:hypothetical protein E6O75_ATG06379 [Venturia nashicola]
MGSPFHQFFRNADTGNFIEFNESLAVFRLSSSQDHNCAVKAEAAAALRVKESKFLSHIQALPYRLQQDTVANGGLMLATSQTRIQDIEVVQSSSFDAIGGAC